MYFIKISNRIKKIKNKNVLYQNPYVAIIKLIWWIMTFNCRAISVSLTLT